MNAKYSTSSYHHSVSTHQPCDEEGQAQGIATTWVDLLQYRAQKHPRRLAYIFLEDGETETERWTYADVDQRAQAIAAHLQKIAPMGTRALLLHPQSLEYIAALLGCLYAGIIAVGAYPPRRNQHLSRLKAIANNSGATLALTAATQQADLQARCAPVLSSAEAQEPEFPSLHWLATDTIATTQANQWQAPPIQKNTLAFLQYTSGSTGNPKGVMVTHENLLANERIIQQAFQSSERTRVVSWLPLFHDMGLVGSALQSLYIGGHCVLFSPVAFLQKPVRWLQAIHRYRATASGGPNFAYDLCVRQISPQQLESLDLSCWELAFNGAEPIRAQTLQKFAKTFARCNFRKSAFYCCYGMAETTLLVSGAEKESLPVVRQVDQRSLQANRVQSPESPESAKEVVSSGKPRLDGQVAIVDPTSAVMCADGVGEIWVSGSSVAQGYWNRPTETEQTFRAFLADTGACAELHRSKGPFLRTGDLGFIQDGELFVVGRLKDTIVIRGLNYYPQDIELTVEQSHPALRDGCGAAVCVDIEGESQLVIVQEVERRFLRDLPVTEIVRAICRAVAAEHELQVYAIALLKTASLPKTSSGKIQRRAAREGFLAQSLSEVARWYRSQGFGDANSENTQADTTDRRLRRHISEVLGVPLSELENGQQGLLELGLDSVSSVELRNSLQTSFQVTLPATLTLEYPTIDDLIAYLKQQIANKKDSTQRPACSERSRTAHTSMTQLPESIAHLSSSEKRSLLKKLLQKQLDENRTFPLSFPQQRLWFLHQLEPDNHAYNIPVAARLHGNLDAVALEKALQEILQRHEVLRTRFDTNERGEPVQIIKPEASLSLPVIDLRQEKAPESLIEQYTTKEAQQPFDLQQAPLVRAKLLRVSDAEHVVLLTLHHIVADGWSMGILVKEMAALYEAFSQQTTPSLPELPIQYIDYAVWQRQHLQGEALESLLAYWRQHIGGNPPTLQLPSDRNPQQESSEQQQGATLPMSVSADLLSQLEEVAATEGVTLFMSLLAAFKTLLYCYSGQEDILVGTDVANRQRSETENLIGFFVNLVPLRTDISGQPSFRTLLQRIRQVALGAYAHQELPFEKLVEELQPQRQAGETPLVRSLFVLQNTPMPAFQTSPSLVLSPAEASANAGQGLTMSSVEVNDQTSKFDLSLFVGKKQGKLVGNWRYRADLFSQNRVEQLSQNFVTLLEKIVTNPDTRLPQFARSIQTNQMSASSFPSKKSKTKQKKPRLSRGKFQKIQPQAIASRGEDLVQASYLPHLQERAFPLVLQPNFAEVDLAEWAQQNRSYLEQKLLQHGAILFRNFHTQSVEKFERVASSICPNLFGDYGDLPRQDVSDRVYGATPYPADRSILFHNESSHMHCWPRKIFFCCLQAASQGGATPIVDCRRIYQKLDPKIREKFEQKGLMYARNYRQDMDVSWQEFFHTDDPSQVEKYCRHAGIEFEWKEGNCLFARQQAPGVIQHPETGEKSFFNQVQLHHIACLEPATRDSLLSLFDIPNLPRHVFYGDGTAIADEDVAAIRDLYEREACRFQWQAGDILMLDNMLAAHGRDPYAGERKIVVAMGDMIYQQDIYPVASK